MTHPAAAFDLIAASNLSMVSATEYRLAFVIKPPSANAWAEDIMSKTPAITVPLRIMSIILRVNA
jgi:hypothetical protein